MPVVPYPEGPLLPTSDIVGAAWLRLVPGLTAGVASAVPSDASTWADNGFVQVQTVGGSPPMHMPVRRPVMSVDCWAVNLNSQKAPWGKANSLAELIRSACEEFTNFGVRLSLPGEYAAARVLTAYLMTEPRRILNDAANYARYQFDLAVDWVVAT